MSVKEETIGEVEESPISPNASHDDYHDHEIQIYKALSKAAVASVIFGFFALIGSLLTEYLLVFSILGLLFGVFAYFQISKYPEELSGLGLAKFGMVLCLLVGRIP